MMAMQADRIAVQGRTRIAASALRMPATVMAKQYRCIATPIEKDQYLFVLLKGGRHRL